MYHRKKCFLVSVLALIFLFPVAGGSGADSSLTARKPGSARTYELVQKLVIKKIDFDNVPVPVVVKFLELKSKELDPDKKGVNFILLKGAKARSAAEPQLSLDLDNIPLDEVIRYLCQVAKLQYRIEADAVVIAYPDVAIDTMATRIFKIKPAAIQNLHP